MHDFSKPGLCPKGVCSQVKKQASKKLGLNFLILIDLNAIHYIYKVKWCIYKDIPDNIVYNNKRWKQLKYPPKETVKYIVVV